MPWGAGGRSGVGSLGGWGRGGGEGLFGGIAIDLIVAITGVKLMGSSLWQKELRCSSVRVS